MAKWRPLDEYSPFARLLVEYMWEQRPPLLPNQFAQRMGVRKQQVSSWLNSDAVASPGTMVRLARGMRRPVSELFIVAGHASLDDPLYDLEEAWSHVLAEVQATPEFLALAEPQRIIIVGTLHAAHLRDRANHTPDVAADSTPPQEDHAGSEEDAEEDESANDTPTAEAEEA